MNLGNILLVDDERGFVETMAKRLTRRHLQVAVALGGQEALDHLSSHDDVEVVILDVKMPAMDGIETLKHIKARHPLVEVIMLTGHATVETAIEGMKQGAMDYLMKPCEMELLLSKVDEAVAQKRRQEEKIAEARIKQITTRRAY